MDRAQIEQRYRADLDAAEAYKDANPERYADLRFEAANRRSDALASLADASDANAREVTLAGARRDAAVAFPLADPAALSGGTPEEIRAAAERSHNHVKAAQDQALTDARIARRPGTREQWTGDPNGRAPGMPGGEQRAPTSRATEQVNAAYDRTAEIIMEAKKPGQLRQYSDDTKRTVFGATDPEAQMLADHALLTPNTGLSQRAMKAKSEGNVTYAPSAAGVPEGEDSRG